MKVGIKKLQSLSCPTVKPHNTTVISFESIPAYDSQTDGLTPYG